MKHDIIVKFTSDFKEPDYPRKLADIEALFSNLKEMEGISDVRLLPNIIDRANRYDLIIEIEMDPAALEAYDASVWHHQWKEEYGKYIEKKAIIDHN